MKQKGRLKLLIPDAKEEIDLDGLPEGSRRITPFTIEHKVPIPPRHERNNELIETLKKMQVGDSIRLESPHLCQRARSWAKRHDRKILGRKLDGDGYRIWRIK